jgi:hypothetical protein
MQPFKQNDPVFILPKFAHLYPGNSAVVISASAADPIHSMLNEYTVAFPNHAVAKLFEFQIIEDVPHYQTLIASVLRDSRQQPSTVQARGEPANRQMILQTPGFDLDMNIRSGESRASIIGQVLERKAKNLLENIEVRLMKDSMAISTTKSDRMGVFKFSDVHRGALNILVTIPQHSSRILGAFSI